MDQTGQASGDMGTAITLLCDLVRSYPSLGLWHKERGLNRVAKHSHTLSSRPA